MKLKNLFYVVATLVFAIILFVSCEPKVSNGVEDDTDNDSISGGSVGEELVYLYGNCTDPINNREDGRFGMNSTYTMSTATMLSGEELSKKGTKIIGIRALIAEEVTDAEVYVAGSLDMNNILVRKSFTWVDEGWQYILFDEPLAITGDSLYIGYTITSSGFAIGLEPAKAMIATEYMYWNDEWYKLSDMGTKGYWSIQAIVQGGDYSAETQHAIVVDKLSIPEATRANSQFKATLEIRNAGVCTIGGLEITSTISGISETTVVDKVMMNGQSAKVEIMVPVGDVEGNVDFAVKAKVKGQDVESEEYKSTLNVYAGLERNAILIEQFTGQNCSNCPAGAAAIKKSILELVDPNKVCWIAHHTYLPGIGDAFTVPGSMEVTNALGVSAFPMCDVNRKQVEYEPGNVKLIWHPAAMTSSLLASLLPIPADATMELTREFNADTRELKVAVKGQSLKDVAYITVLVNQDNMVAQQAGASGEYRHTAPRKFLTEGTGDRLILDAEGNYSVEYTYTIPEKVGSFDCVLEDMEIVAFVHGDINDRNNREIYNADKIDILK